MDTWRINKKKVQITNPNMYFSSEKSVLTKIFTPFIADATHFEMSPAMGDNKMDSIKNPTLEESIFILKNTEAAFIMFLIMGVYPIMFPLFEKVGKKA